MTDLLATPGQRVSVRALGGYLPRLCRWPVLVGGVVLAWALTWWRSGGVEDGVGAVWLVRGVLAVGSVGAVFALDDPSRNQTESLPGVSNLTRARLALALGVLAVASLPAGLAVGSLLPQAAVWGLVLEGATVLLLVCALSQLLQRRWRVDEPAQFLVLAVLIIPVIDQLSTGRWPLLTGPGAPWAHAHWRWAGLAVLSGGVLFWNLRDPASARIPWLRRVKSPVRG